MRIRAKKSLGQNFLVNEGVLARIVQSAQIEACDTIVEIGPGTGNLTRKLIATGARVVAIEKDRRLIEPLEKSFPSHEVIIIEDDALKLDPSTLGLKSDGYKVVANIPYYITSNLIRTIFEKWPIPKMLVLMVQKEVAQRICAKPGDMNILALSVQFYAIPEIIMNVSAGSFRPIPTVDSAILRLSVRHITPSIFKERFFEIIKAGFSSKRKVLSSLLSDKLKIPKKDIQAFMTSQGIGDKARAQDLSLEQWVALSKFNP